LGLLVFGLSGLWCVFYEAFRKLTTVLGETDVLGFVIQILRKVTCGIFHTMYMILLFYSIWPYRNGGSFGWKTCFDKKKVLIVAV
jgi:hypothetical protein